MQEVTFHLQTVTPLFMAGADYASIKIPERSQRKYRDGELVSSATEGWDVQPEIRSPSFRGLMRYWLRALIGGLSPMMPLSLNDVTQIEQSIFGSTEQSSAIHLRISEISRKAERFRKDRESVSPSTITGKDYLHWSMAESGKAVDYKPDRWYFPEGTQFKVTLTEHTMDSATPHVLPYAAASLWLLANLGGIGSRSHRCAGNLQVQQVIGDVGKLSFDEATSKEELQTLLEQGIREAQALSVTLLRAVDQPKGGTPLTTNSFDRLSLLHKGDQSSSPYSCQIWILTQNNGSPWQSLKDALNAIGTQLKTYRRTLSPEERTTFGLPLNTKLPDKAVATAMRDSRRASPLLLRITKLGTGRYVGVAVLFKTAAPAIMNAQGTRILVPEPDYTLIENWITTRFPKALEVRL